jgi:hypothetical protein
MSAIWGIAVLVVALLVFTGLWWRRNQRNEYEQVVRDFEASLIYQRNSKLTLLPGEKIDFFADAFAPDVAEFRRQYPNLKTLRSARKSASQTVEAHILDPLHGDRIEEWIIGEHVPVESVSTYGEAGKIYALIGYEAGVARTMLLKRLIWLDVKEKFSRIGKPQ